MFTGLFYDRSIRCLLLIIACSLSGCATRAKFYRPHFAHPQPEIFRLLPDCLHGGCDQASEQVETLYLEAAKNEKQCDARCLDGFIAVARITWPSIAAGTATPRQQELYNSSVGRLIQAAQTMGRFDPNIGIHTGPGIGRPRGAAMPACSCRNERGSAELNQNEGPQVLPIRFVGFAWQPNEMQRFGVLGKYKTTLDRKCGLGAGVPLLGFPCSQRPFVATDLPFSAVAVLRDVPCREGSYPMLEIVNPHVKRQLCLSSPHKVLPLAYDLTSPLSLRSTENATQWLDGLFNQDSTPENERGLRMTTPYQRGKIPVIFVHGLASDPVTWAAMYNELQMQPHLFERYQFWVFSYPTGEPFPLQAARFRSDLARLRQQVDPQASDPALDNLLVIGHSMGGLVTKMQIMNSGQRLAQAVVDTRAEFDQLSPQIKQALFWTPNPQIRRVIFIGTPHRGSPRASRPIARLISLLIRRDGNLVDGVGGVISDSRSMLTRRSRQIPSSIDLLRSDDPLLQAIDCSPISPCVSLHTIAGIGHRGCCDHSIGDGVVPLESARVRGAESERFIDAGHDMHRTPEAIQEVLRIMELHWSETCKRSAQNQPLPSHPIELLPTLPELSSPELSSPELSEPKLSEPKLSEPKLSEPKLSEPKLSEPKLSEPKLPEPKLPEPQTLPSPQPRTPTPQLPPHTPQWQQRTPNADRAMRDRTLQLPSLAGWKSPIA